MALPPGSVPASIYLRAKALVVETSDAGDNQRALLQMALFLASDKNARALLGPELVRHLKGHFLDKDYWDAHARDIIANTVRAPETMTILAIADHRGLLEALVNGDDL